MTQDQAISIITAHINSGKIFMLHVGQGYTQGSRMNWFWWASSTRESAVWVEHPIVLGRALSEQEVLENWYEEMPIPSDLSGYFEVLVD